MIIFSYSIDYLGFLNNIPILLLSSTLLKKILFLIKEYLCMVQKVNLHYKACEENSGLSPSTHFIPQLLLTLGAEG